jgi:hypothetical protein
MVLSKIRFQLRTVSEPASVLQMIREVLDLVGRIGFSAESLPAAPT